MKQVSCVDLRMHVRAHWCVVGGCVNSYGTPDSRTQTTLADFVFHKIGPMSDTGTVVLSWSYVLYQCWEYGNYR